jgi:transcriptional regulator with XRE-family HTH domain
LELKSRQHYRRATMDISKVLDDAKAELGIDSDYKLAKYLEISNGYIAEWRRGKRIPDAYACMRLADALKIDPIQLLAQIEAETEKNEAPPELLAGFVSESRGRRNGLFFSPRRRRD